jgi:hypothetical protein
MRPKKVSYHSLSKEEGLCNIRFKYNIKSVWKLYTFYGLIVISWAKLMQNELILDAGADQTRLVRTLGA